MAERSAELAYTAVDLAEKALRRSRLRRWLLKLPVRSPKPARLGSLRAPAKWALRRLSRRLPSAAEKAG